MSDSKYHTIDPLILETLNLNEKRMNHIFDILHERPSKSKKPNVKLVKKKFSFENSLREDLKNESTLLPQIVRRNQAIETSKPKINSNKERRYRTIDNSRSIINRSQKQSINDIKSIHKSINKQINKSEEAQTIKQQDNQMGRKLLSKKSRVKSTLNEQINIVSLMNNEKEYSVKEYSFKNSQSQRNPTRNSVSAVRRKLAHSKLSSVQSPSLQQLSPRNPNNQSEAILQESLLPSALLKKENQTLVYKNKRKQMISDYMGEFALKKSKSMMLNSKDFYRLEIEKIIAELTPIERLEQAEKRMKRVKKRYQHLKHFDQKYYSRLNQMELLAL